MWKKSNDGGLDYEVSQETKTKEEFNPFATAFTTTFNMEFHELPTPLPHKKRVKDRIAENKWRRTMRQ